ncbi:hypothetical protein DM02DRAFT_653701 [Periconia macrospinosa]|uniref:RING-type domain-containing protein n=1 Tax=Periconia macrospinosa TaxID=97972 RepID=A0A2V1DY36_9PLEO|nr:hypothetical protein DM02DRAFT_653701 [Periconia macrospinosa]
MAPTANPVNNASRALAVQSIASARLYARIKNSFPTLLAVIDGNGGNGRKAGEALGIVSAIAASMAAHSIHPSEPPSNWHRAFKPHYLTWVKGKDNAENMEVLQETDDNGHQITFVNELRSWVQTKVKSTVAAGVRASRNEFDDLEEDYPIWALRNTRRACDEINLELLKIAKHHLASIRPGTSRQYSDLQMDRAFKRAVRRDRRRLDFPPFLSTPHDDHDEDSGSDEESVADDTEQIDVSSSSLTDLSSTLSNASLSSPPGSPRSNQTPSQDVTPSSAGRFRTPSMVGVRSTSGRNTPTQARPSPTPSARSWNSLAQSPWRSSGQPRARLEYVENPNLPDFSFSPYHPNWAEDEDGISQQEGAQFPNESDRRSHTPTRLREADEDLRRGELTPVPMIPRRRRVEVDDSLFARPLPNLSEEYAAIGQDCSICTENFLLMEAVNGEIVQTVCGHSYHRACLREWVNGQSKASCPHCRRVLFEEDDPEESVYAESSSDIEIIVDAP